MRPSTPARVDSRDCWEPLVANMASMLAGVGGAAKAVAADKERMRVKRGLFIDDRFDLECCSLFIFGNLEIPNAHIYQFL